MKNHLYLILLTFFTGASLVKCSKPVEEILKPRLLITLQDDSGKQVRGARVRLYRNVNDSGIIKLSDSSGVVLFSDLDTTLYYWLATKGCKTNGVSQTSLNRPLETGVVLYGYSVLTETGVLKIVSSSAESYKVSDTVATAIVNKDSPYIAYRKVSRYRIHSEKVSTPGQGKDTLVIIKCGDTSVLTVPY